MANNKTQPDKVSPARQGKKPTQRKKHERLDRAADVPRPRPKPTLKPKPNPETKPTSKPKPDK